MSDPMFNYGQQPDPYGNNILGQQNQGFGGQFSMDQFQTPMGMPSIPGAGGADQGGGMFSMDSILGNSKTGTQGWGMPALQTFGGLASMYMGMKQYGLAKDSLKENKRQFNINHGNQVKLTNSRLEDRQRARVVDSPGHFESVGNYMKKNGVE